MKLLLILLLAALPFGDLQYRWIGPAVMGGRLDVVAGIPGDPKTIYLGHSSAGLWKSTDGGLSFDSIFDAAESTAIGAIAIDPRNSKRIYIGTGESFPRNTADPGAGMWRSDDAGAHWHLLGFTGGGSITRIAVDPADSNLVLAAVLGTEFTPNTERGIYRSTDAGAHWTRVLYVNDTTGGSDVAFDPKRPSVVYAGTFDFLRKPWTMRSGGPGSGLYRSRDGGRSWQRLTNPMLHNGLPEGPINRVGFSICRSNTNVVYAFVPVARGMLYRTTDGGATWQMRNADQDINFRPFYFSQVRCDPQDTNRVYAIGGALLVSTDGGTKFKDAGGGGDNHDLWIDPTDPQRLLNGSDMGFHYSVDRGKTWSYDDVVPFAQIYRAGYDMDVPYHVMGGLQDHEVWWGPSSLFSARDGASNGDWLNIADWGDGQYAMADPRDSSIVYEDTHFGDLARLDLKTGERRYISPQPILGFGTGASTYKYRFNWSAPLLLSHFDPDVLYYGGNVLFRSPDQGSTWSVVSPDLTQCGADQLGPSGGPITRDNTNAESYCTIYSIGEDAKDSKTIWYGTDNGHLEVTRDGGSTWNDVAARLGVTLPGRFSCVSPSPVRTGIVYASIDRHQWGDNAPHVYVSDDFGATWRSIGSGLDGYVHAIREDPRNPNVLYAGTERGIYVSFDGGSQWNDMRLGLPHIPVYDIQVHPRDNDLIVATHGRGFFILDDLSPLQHWPANLDAPQLYAADVAYRYTGLPYHEHGRGAFVADNRAYGAIGTLYLPQAPPAAPKHKPSVTVHVFDSANKEIDAFPIPVHAGMNRFAWDLRVLPLGGLSAVQDVRPYYIFVPMSVLGPQVLPGTYTMQVTAGGSTMRAGVEVRIDPHSKIATQDLQAQYDALLKLAAIQERAERLMAKLRPLKTPAAAALLDQLRNAEPSGYRQPARVSEQIAYLRDTIEQYSGAPTAVQLALMQQYDGEVSELERQVNALPKAR